MTVPDIGPMRSRAKSPFRRPTLFVVLGLLLLAGGALSVSAFSLTGYTWPAGTQIMMHLQLERASGPLQDGSADWNASASEALNSWNQNIDTVKFVAAAPTGLSNADGANEVLFSDTFYGESWPTGVLAVTLKISSQGSTLKELDVLFNNKLNWDSYRGPLQGSGPTGTYDLYRVALHEFGHVLGLDHPDTHGQSVVAQMNSIVSNLDQLADDDVAGALSLYGVKITSFLGMPPVDAGTAFHYQITTNFSPSSFDVTGLPPGLSVDHSTGLISGTPTAGGTYSITLVAHGPPRDATATISMTVIPARITSASLASVHINAVLNYTIAATNNPYAFDVTGLPAGLSLDRSTGVITGTLGTLGNYPVTVIAHTPYGDGSASIVISVVPWDITSNYYPPATLGGDFKFQITANNNPTSFEALNLPPGLQLDSVTGLITGTVTLSGSFNFTVIAHGAKGDAVGKMYIGVQAAPPLQPKPAGAIRTFDFAPQHLVSDPIRSRVYASDQNGNVIVVIDTASLNPIATIKLPHTPLGMSVSADKTKLWVACTDGFTYAGWIVGLDLEKLEVVSTFNVAAPISSVGEGPGNRLYASGEATITLNASTGATLATLSYPTGQVGVHQDVLYLSQRYGAGLQAYDVSQGQMQLREQDNDPHNSAGGRDFKVSHNGQYIASFAPTGNGRVYGLTSTALFSGADVRNVLGNFINNSSNFAVSVGPAAFSNDDTVFYQPAAIQNVDTFGTSRLEIFDIASFSQTGLIDLGHVGTTNNAPDISDMVVDSTGAYIFVSSSVYGYAGQLRVYSTGRGTAPPIPVTPDRSVLNVSTRLRVDAGDNAGIGGFIINGSAPKKVMIRAVGPSLSKAGVAGALSDPSLQVFDSSGQQIGQNDNWNAHRTEALIAGLAPTDEHEAALVLTLQPGAYTAVVRGAGAAAGVALVEVYDLSATDTGSKVANISTRGRVGTADDAMIGGFIIGGTQTTRVVVRAIGPSLANYGVAGTLADPTLEVHDGNGGLLAQDDDWRMYQEGQLTENHLAPIDDRESAMILLLQPGAYTAVVHGKANSTGVALIEVYNLDAN